MRNQDVLTGQVLSWRLERDKRLKKIYVQVHPQEGIVVRAPQGVSRSRIMGILAARQQWLSSLIEETALRCPRREYADGSSVPYLGRELSLRIFASQGRPHAQWLDQEIYLYLAPELGQDRDQVRDFLQRAYKAQASSWFPTRVQQLNARHFGYNLGNIRVKNLTRVLGSCSDLGNLNFNWRLVLAPAEVVDYVIIHELAHMKEMNHSQRFWKAVAQACPDYRLHRSWLKEMSGTLYI